MTMKEFDDEFGWLIESRHHGFNMWWSGGTNFTSDSVKAVRFARCEDAQRVIDNDEFLKDIGSFASEHIWYGPKEGV